MKVIGRFFSYMLVGIGIWSAGCFANKTTVELVNYMNQEILRIAELEQKSIETYLSVTGANYTSDDRVYEALEGFVIPQYGRFLDLLRQIHPEGEELKILHSMYIRGSDQIYAGFKTKSMGLETGDERIIQTGNESIEKGNIEIGRWRGELARLYQKYGIAAQDR